MSPGSVLSKETCASWTMTVEQCGVVRDATCYFRQSMELLSSLEAEQNGHVLSKPASTNTKSFVLLSGERYQCLMWNFVFGSCREPQSIIFPLTCF